MEQLLEAKKFIQENKQDGVNCPCCGKYVRQYERKINSGMILFLIGLYRLTKPYFGRDEIYFDNKEILMKMNLTARSLDYSILKHFKLIKDDYNDDESKRKSGIWRLTNLGRKFVEGNVRLKKYAVIFNGKFIEYKGDFVSIKDCLGSKFNYSELLKN